MDKDKDKNRIEYDFYDPADWLEGVSLIFSDSL